MPKAPTFLHLSSYVNEACNYARPPYFTFCRARLDYRFSIQFNEGPSNSREMLLRIFLPK
jgi:hypothetical protein